MDLYTEQDIHAVRRQAAALLATKPLMKGRFLGPDGAICLTTAIATAIKPDVWIPRESPSMTRQVNRVCQAMGFVVRPNADAINKFGIAIGPPDEIDEACEWNNAPERTKDEVIARLLDGLPAETTVQ